MKATCLWPAAVLLAAASASLAQAAYSPVFKTPLPVAPDACGPGYYQYCPYGDCFGPNYCLYPPCPPTMPIFGPPAGGAGPAPIPGVRGFPGYGPGPYGAAGPPGTPMFPSHPYSRGPRDFFMIGDE